MSKHQDVLKLWLQAYMRDRPGERAVAPRYHAAAGGLPGYTESTGPVPAPRRRRKLPGDLGTNANPIHRY